MSRRMSCSMTVEAVRDRSKTVTRRHIENWAFLKPGDHLTLIEKGMGLPKGSKQVVLAEVEVLDVRQETLRQVTAFEVAREGLLDRALDEGQQFADYYDADDLPRVWFQAFWASSHLHGSLTDWAIGPLSGARTGVLCRRIEWCYLPTEGDSSGHRDPHRDGSRMVHSGRDVAP